MSARFGHEAVRHARMRHPHYYDEKAIGGSQQASSVARTSKHRTCQMSIALAEEIPTACTWIPNFRSDDLDEVRAFFGGIHGSRSRVTHSNKPMGCVAYHVIGPSICVGRTASAVGQTARWLVDDPILQLSVPAGSVFRAGRQMSAPTRPSSAVLLPPAWEWARTTPPGPVFAVKVRAGALRNELRATQPSTGGHLPGRFIETEIDADLRASLFAAFAGAAQASRPGADPQQAALAEARLLMQVAALIPHGPTELRPADMTEQRSRDLEGWIDAHLGDPITLGGLCQVAGVGARCLQRNFQYRRGVSPMRFVAERRLTATHHALLDADPRASVTRIALAHGFDHFGRFAQLYREVIGELPSQTLARQRTR